MKKIINKDINNKGITLIALVITIIVLLILAGITITMLTGDNGILGKADEAKLKTTEAEEKEALILACNGIIPGAELNSITEENLKEELINKNKRTDIEEIKGDEPTIVTFVSGRTYVVDSDGSVGILDDIANHLKIGDYVNYPDQNGNKILCKVLYNDESNGVQIVSVNPIDTVTLGITDPSIPEEIQAKTNREKSVYSFNNAIIRLNDKAEEYRNSKLTSQGNARCLGSNPNNPANESDYFTGSYEYLTKFNINGTLRDTDNNYNEDWLQLEKIKARAFRDTSIATTYWLASRNVHCTEGGTNFMVRFSSNAGALNSGSVNLSRLVLFYSNGEYYGEGWQCATQGIRPVFKLKPTVKIDDSINGDGTSESMAYELK